MKIEYRGLVVEKRSPSRTLYRVRPKGDAKTRITLSCGPGDDDFNRQYRLARAGIKPEPLKKVSDVAEPYSIGWLLGLYLEHFEREVKAGTKSAKTLKKKRNLLNRLIVDPDKKMMIPQEKLLAMKDEMAATPAQADAFIEAVAVFYDWALKRKHVDRNPARGIDKTYFKGGGATPWKIADVLKFYKTHAPGSKAHVALSVLLFTGCRIEDLTVLGRKHECVIEDVPALRWFPGKKGSSEVCIPLLDPLRVATRAPKIVGDTYVLGRGGKPYASGDAMSAMFKRWCIDAGLEHLSAHGVRKGLAEILAELGCSQFQIMAVLGHSEAKTSEIYTRRVERWRLAKDAMEAIDLSTLGLSGGQHR